MFYGPFIFVRKPQETEEREDKNIPPVTLIHDTEAAKALGFRGGFVGGLTLLNAEIPAIDASFGHLWFAGGTLSVRNRTPVYESELRVVWEDTAPEKGESGRISYCLENHEGEQTNHGWAALPASGEKPVPPWERNPVKHTSVGVDALPELVVGTSRKPFVMNVALKDTVARMDELKQYNWWYRYASPWGPPILNAFEICFALYQGVPQHPSNPLRSPRLITSMDAGTDLIVYEPLFTGRNYVMKASLVDKWQTDKTVFFTTHYDYEDEYGKLVAQMRANSAHLIRALAPA